MATATISVISWPGSARCRSGRRLTRTTWSAQLLWFRMSLIDRGISHTRHSTAMRRKSCDSRSVQSILADGKELVRRDDLAAPGWTFDAQGVLRVRHEGSHTVQILGGSAGQGQA